MPRRKRAAGVSSAIRKVQQQARGVLITLQNEIRAKEGELRQLKDEESRLSQLFGRAAAAPKAAPRARGGGRINWRAVLKQLPKEFKASNVRSVRGLKGKRPSEIFAAITRWIDAGLAKRKARGVYERA
ncbi:MAG TPA: hypothetical protein VEC38_00955 [Candidatus Binataceae bacterium]|nr:hypothetical protein [Candidatus Binataceae bacterium]